MMTIDKPNLFVSGHDREFHGVLLYISLVPRPHPSAREKGLVTIAGFLGIAHQYAGHIYVNIRWLKRRSAKPHTYFVVPQVMWQT